MEILGNQSSLVQCDLVWSDLLMTSHDSGIPEKLPPSRWGPGQRRRLTLSVLSCFLSDLTTMRSLRTKLLLCNSHR